MVLSHHSLPFSLKPMKMYSKKKETLESCSLPPPPPNLQARRNGHMKINLEGSHLQVRKEPSPESQISRNRQNRWEINAVSASPPLAFSQSSPGRDHTPQWVLSRQPSAAGNEFPVLRKPGSPLHTLCPCSQLSPASLTFPFGREGPGPNATP